jgi:hypothetical protein
MQSTSKKFLGLPGLPGGDTGSKRRFTQLRGMLCSMPWACSVAVPQLRWWRIVRHACSVAVRPVSKLEELCVVAVGEDRLGIITFFDSRVDATECLI